MKHIKRTIGLLFITTFLLLAGCWGDDEDKKEVVKIGAILPFTGDAAIYGENTKKGILLGLENINKQLAKQNKEIKVIFEDSKAEAKTGVAGVRKLINTDKVVAIIDDSVSAVTLAVAPIIEKNKVVLLATGATAPAITGAGEYVFRLWNSDTLEGKVVAQYTDNIIKAKQVAILYINNAYGVGLRDVFKSSYKGQIVSEQAFDQGSTNLKTLLQKIKGKSLDMIYLVAYPKEAGVIFEQAKAIALNTKWFGTVAIAEEKLLNNTKKLGINLYYPSPEKVNNDAARDFTAQYKKKYKDKPPLLADVGYDAITMIGNAVLNSKNTTGTAIKNIFNKLPKKNMASGVIEFDKNGDVNKPINIKSL
ncbi:MAG: ABC transporter substrate-binding protein [Urechidicola sp.]|nr:ABC transporter substrate-binding protein [Urechidicola sp.]